MHEIFDKLLSSSFFISVISIVFIRVFKETKNKVIKSVLGFTVSLGVISTIILIFIKIWTN